MNPTARRQAWSAIVAGVALPLLYTGGAYEVPALSIAGLCLFAAGLLASPTLQFASRRKKASTAATATLTTK